MRGSQTAFDKGRLPMPRDRILVIEDEKDTCDLLHYLLEGEGYEVEQACSSADALLKVERKLFHLIMVDITMDGTDGLEVLRRIQRAARGAVLIVIAGRCSLKTALEAVCYHAADYLSKPFEDPGEVLAAVQRGLAERPKIPAVAD
jgi:DNA-binding NtrC family response regulator